MTTDYRGWIALERARELMRGMNDAEYFRGVDQVCETLLKNAPKSFGVDFGVLNAVMIETSRRLAEIGGGK